MRQSIWEKHLAYQFIRTPAEAAVLPTKRWRSVSPPNTEAARQVKDKVMSKDSATPSTARRAMVITISDRASAGQTEDKSGPLIEEMLAEAGFEIVSTKLLPDEQPMIAEALVEAADGLRAALVVTTGGTGLAPRDVTPEATLSAIDRRVPGMEEAMRADGLIKTPHAMLSRGVVGTRGGTLIVNLPGSPKAVQESLSYIMKVLPHALDLLSGGRVSDESHQAI